MPRSDAGYFFAADLGAARTSAAPPNPHGRPPFICFCWRAEQADKKKGRH